MVVFGEANGDVSAAEHRLGLGESHHRIRDPKLQQLNSDRSDLLSGRRLMGGRGGGECGGNHLLNCGGVHAEGGS